jgi:hypothetical protein
LAVDPLHSRIYWNGSEGVVKSANLDGTDIQTIVTNTSQGDMTISEQYIPEPATLLLLGLGGMMLRNRKS